MGFSRQKDWSGLPFPTPGDLPDPEIEPVPFAPPALAGGFLITGATWEALLLLSSIFPSISVFTKELALASGSRSTGVSASAPVLPMNTSFKIQKTARAFCPGFPQQ